MAPLRFGLLGTGYWALHTHGTALSSSPRAVLQGVWGRDPAKAEDLGRRLGSKGYGDLDQLLDEVEAVSIAVPPDIQAELAVRAARAGCHLLLDKPLALGIPAAAAVVQAAAEAGVASVVFFTARYQPAAERWIEATAHAGPWHHAHLVHYASLFQPGNPYAASAWRREYGALWDVGPHALAALVPVLGRVTSVAARSGPVGSDTVHLVLGHGPQSPDVPPGPVSTSTLSLSLTVPPAAAGTGLVFYGEHGARTRPEAAWEPVDPFRNAIAELATMVDSGERRHRCGVHFGLEVVRVLSAAEQALDLPAVDLHY